MDDSTENSMIFFQVFDMVDIGLVILDKDLRIRHWNRWMQLHSGIDSDKIKGSIVFNTFPNLERPHFMNNCKTIRTFGNFCFFLKNYITIYFLLNRQVILIPILSSCNKAV